MNDVKIVLPYIISSEKKIMKVMEIKKVSFYFLLKIF